MLKSIKLNIPRIFEGLESFDKESRNLYISLMENLNLDQVIEILTEYRLRKRKGVNYTVAVFNCFCNLCDKYGINHNDYLF